MEDQNMELTIIDKSVPEFKNGNVILLEHQSRASKALAVAESINEGWQLLYEIGDLIETEDFWKKAAEIDARSNKFLANCAGALKEMKAKRSPYSAMIDMILKAFTAEENKLDTKYSEKVLSVQKFRNKYAADYQAEEKKKAEAAQRKVDKKKEENNFRINVQTTIAQALSAWTIQQKSDLNNLYAKVTLENYDESFAKLEKEKGILQEEAREKIQTELLTKVQTAGLRTIYHQEAEGITFLNEEWNAFNFNEYKTEAAARIVEHKYSLLDRMPGLHANLLEQKRLKDQNDKEAADKLEADKQKEQLRQQQELQKEQISTEEKINSTSFIAKETAHASTLFDQQAEVMPAENKPEVRNGYNIKVLSPAGWIQLISFWYEEKGKTLGLDEYETMTFARVKKYAEDRAKKDDHKIESKLLHYEEEVKAVNRKEKK